MSKILTSSQMLGEIGETAVRRRFLDLGFQFDGRSRLPDDVQEVLNRREEGAPPCQGLTVGA